MDMRLMGEKAADSRRYFKGKHPGVRWREHPERKHGVKPDRYFSIRYKLDGKDRQEALGWASEGMTEAKAAARLAELRENQRTGVGPMTLSDKREKAKVERQARDEAESKARMDRLALADVWPSYLAAQTIKTQGAVVAEKGLFLNWIEPTLGSIPIRRLSQVDVQRLIKNMLDAKKSARTVDYAIAVCRQIINFCRDNKMVDAVFPKVKSPQRDNKRVRFLSFDEADRLVIALALRSLDVRDMALLSLHTGLRAGEIFALTWGDVDFERGVIHIRDTKNKKDRVAFITAPVEKMLKSRGQGEPGELIFPARNGGRIVQMSDTFNRTVQDLGFNAGISDPKQKVVFHTLRHTFASWLVEQGTDLYRVQSLMGHSSLTMVQRYSHLSENGLRAAATSIELRSKKKVLRTNAGGSS